MKEMMTINNNKLMIKEYEGQRVVTLWDIARLHNTQAHSIRMNFERNLNKLIENEDYFLVPKQGNFARTISASKEVTFQAINASKNIPVFTESGYLMMTKPMQDELSWQVQRQLVKGYFKLQEIKSALENDDVSNKLENLQLEQQGLKLAVDLLKPSKASTVRMLKDFNNSQGLSTAYLPDYVDEKAGRSATELLKKFNIPMSTVKFNKLMLEHEFLKEETRTATNKQGFKKYKSFTDKGLKYGKNKSSTYGSEKETQPLYYEDTFIELVNILAPLKEVI